MTRASSSSGTGTRWIPATNWVSLSPGAASASGPQYTTIGGPLASGAIRPRRKPPSSGSSSAARPRSVLERERDNALRQSELRHGCQLASLNSRSPSNTSLTSGCDKKIEMSLGWCASTYAGSHKPENSGTSGRPSPPLAAAPAASRTPPGSPASATGSTVLWCYAKGGAEANVVLPVIRGVGIAVR